MSARTVVRNPWHEKPLLAYWNRDFSKPRDRRSNLRDIIRARLRETPRGRGNKAWGRWEQMNKPRLGEIVWPFYALPTGLERVQS